MATFEQEKSVIDSAIEIVKVTIEEGNRWVEQVAKGVLYTLTTAKEVDLPESVSDPNIKRQQEVVDLALKLSDLIESNDLFIVGSNQPELFRIARIDTGCKEGGVLFIGPNFEEALVSRPDSAIAELLYEASLAAAVGGKRLVINDLKMAEVEEVMVSFLRTLPKEAPMTPWQRSLIRK